MLHIVQCKVYNLRKSNESLWTGLDLLAFASIFAAP